MGAVPLNFLVERVPDHLIPGPCDSLMPCPPPAILVQRAPGGAQASESPKFPGISAAGVHGLRFEDAHTFCFTEERKATTCGKALIGPNGQSRGHPVWLPGLRFPTQHPTCCWAAASGNSAPLGCPAPLSCRTWTTETFSTALEAQIQTWGASRVAVPREAPGENPLPPPTPGCRGQSSRSLARAVRPPPLARGLSPMRVSLFSPLTRTSGILGEGPSALQRDLTLTWLCLHRPYLQIRPHSEVPGRT